MIIPKSGATIDPYNPLATAMSAALDYLQVCLEPEAVEDISALWPDQYWNDSTKRPYKPHHDAEAGAVFGFGPRFVLFRGGEGSGKTTAGAIKTCERVKLGQSGMVVAPNMPHFKRSTWPELRRWIPWDSVIESQQYRKSINWEPTQQFLLAFRNGATLLCGGIHDPDSWEGPNLHFAWIDEARHLPDATVIKIVNGRVRLQGAGGEPSQIWLTTTSRKNWLFDWFGPLKEDEPDRYADVKAKRLDVQLYTADNEHNLDPGFVEDRVLGMSDSEKLVVLEGAWEDYDHPNAFLAEIIWWDACYDDLPPLGKHEPLFLAVDAAKGAEGGDSFCIAGVTRHPDPALHRDVLAVRYAREWKFDSGISKGYEAQRKQLKWLCRNYAVVQVAYDPYQLHDFMHQLRQEIRVNTQEFSQKEPRLKSDSYLHSLILRKGIRHNGHKAVRRHILNADAKFTANMSQRRIVKRTQSLKIDLAVAISMAAWICQQTKTGVPIFFSGESENV